MAADKMRPCSNARIHLVLFPFPAQGHMIPLMQLGNALALKGFTITFVCAEHRIPLMQEAAYRGQYHPSLRILTLPDTQPPGEQGVDEGTASITWSIKGTQKMLDPFRELIRDLLQVAADCHEETAGGEITSAPVGIVSDYALSWTQDIADEFCMPRYVFFPSAASGLLFMFYVPRLVADGQLPLAGDGNADVVDADADAEVEASERCICVPGLPPVRIGDVSTAWLATSHQWLHRFSLRNAERLHDAAGILVNSFSALEADAIPALRSALVNPRGVSVHTVGPLLPPLYLHNATSFSPPTQPHRNPDPSLQATEQRCLRWLDHQRASSVLYVSFGSIVLPSLPQIHELAFGLQATKRPFLWVLRQPSSSLLPEGFQLQTENQGLIVTGWAPQLLILSHPSAAAFLTHCGWNSTVESVSRGIPMVGMPFFADQMMNCRMLVEQLQIAVQISKSGGGLARRDAVSNSVEMVMGSEAGVAMRERVRELRDAARIAVLDEEGCSHNNLNAFVDQIRMHSTCNSKAFSSFH